MSYDIDLRMDIDTGGPEPVSTCFADIGNYTSNVPGMWREALGRSLGDLHGEIAGDCVDELTRAVAAMEADPAKYEAMNPANGWGDHAGALDYLRRLRDACAAHPKTVIYISR
jgi:hypothetical protein